MMKLYVILLICAGSVCVAAAGDSVVRPAGKRIMFLGDSITHGGYCLYYLQLMENLRHPGSTTRYYNAGYSGATVEVGIGNCKWEVDRIKPDCAFLMFGMNDVHWSEYPTDEVMTDDFKGRADYYVYLYKLAYPGLLKALIETNGISSVTLVTPTPYDEYSTTLAAMRRRNVSEYGLKNAAKVVRDIAEANNLPVVELNDPMTGICKRYPEEGWCGTDRVHPQRLGHLFMAVQFWKSFGEDGLVASVVLSVDGTVKKSDNAEVAGVVKSSRGLSFDYKPSALPFPSLSEYERLRELYPEIGNYNREMLVVEGLARGKWQLLANGRPVGVFSAAEFASGVNLAELDTPNQDIALRAADVMTALHDFDVALRDRRVYQKETEVVPSDLAEQERLYDELAAVRPVGCRFEIREGGWFDANVESYAKWPEDAQLAYGGSWTDETRAIPQASALPVKGALQVEYPDSFVFEAASSRCLSVNASDVTICSEVELDAWDKELLPVAEPGAKGGVLLIKDGGVGRYYGLVKTVNENKWVPLEGPTVTPEYRKAIICVRLRKTSAGVVVNYSIDNCWYKYQDSIDMPIATSNHLVSEVKYSGEGAVRRLYATATQVPRGVVFLVR